MSLTLTLEVGSSHFKAKDNTVFKNLPVLHGLKVISGGGYSTERYEETPIGFCL